MTLFIKKRIVANLRQLVFLSFLVFLVYANSLGNEFVSDDSAIKNSTNIGSTSYFLSRPQAFIQPLLYYTIHKITGMNPLMYRLNNIIFHLLTVIVIYFIFLRMSNKKLALITASLFAVHPILTESVAWISGGNYVRYSFFFLSSFLLYISSKENFIIYFFSLIFLTLTFFNAAHAVAVPLIFFLYDFVFSDIYKKRNKLAGIFFISCGWIIYYLSQINTRAKSIVSLSYGHGQFFDNPLIQIPIAVGTYLKLLLWPDQLTLYHTELNISLIKYAGYLLIFILFVCLTLFLYRKNKIIFFWLAFFFIILSPTLTPFRIGWIVAERYVYLASLGIIFAAAYLIDLLVESKKYKKIGILIFIVILTAFSVRTILRNSDWKNEDTLWIATGKTSPSYPVTHNNLGDVFARRGDYEQSIAEFKKAIELKPNYADAYHNLANIYRLTGKNDEAMANYKQAIKFNPSLWQSYNNIASIYFDRGDPDNAEIYTKKAIKLNPEDSGLQLNLGLIYLKMNNKNQAKLIFQAILKSEPENIQAKTGLADSIK